MNMVEVFPILYVGAVYITIAVKLLFKSARREEMIQ